jgi:hypothetical protein
MKISAHIDKRSRTGGFTFTTIEMVIATTILAMAVTALVSTQIYGMRVYTLAATKLSATASARKSLNDIRDQIRGADWVDVGNYVQANGSPTNFALIPEGSLQEGNALRILPGTTNWTATVPYTLIYLQPTAGGTNFAVVNSSGNPVANTNQLIMLEYSNDVILLSNTVASYITNQTIFYAEDYWANVLTNNQDNRVIQVTMFFSQWEYPIAVIGSNDINAYDYYRLQTRATRRPIQ